MKIMISIMIALSFSKAYCAPNVSGSIDIFDEGSCWYHAVAYSTATVLWGGYVTSTARLGAIGGTQDNVNSYLVGSGTTTITNRTWSSYYPHGQDLIAGGSHFVQDLVTGTDSALSSSRGHAVCPSSGGGDDECEGETDPYNWDPLNQDSCDSPIIIDLNGDGIACSGQENPVMFDLWGVGTAIPLSWTLPGSDDAFLVLDLNKNGHIDDGRELFGSGTRLWMQDELFALNGFVGLAQYDFLELGGDRDQVITPNDEIWSQLMLWNDFNANGVSDQGELSFLNEQGFTSLETIPKEKRKYDGHGNWYRYWAKAATQHGARQMIDVYFVRYPMKNKGADRY